MEFKCKSMLSVALLAACGLFVASCSDDSESSNPESGEQKLAAINSDFVNKTVLPTYTGLMKGCEGLVIILDAMEDDDDVEAACEAWKETRQYWEWSEAFLFGAASSYGIDPHIDTWPFDEAAFNSYMEKYSPSTNEDDAAILTEAIATGQSLTGFHAVEYLLFRDGAPRAYSDMTADEIWFCQTAAQDLCLNSIRLVAAWGGDLTEAEAAVLAEAELEPEDNFGEEMINAGKAGSRWKTVLQGSKQIILGCQNILDEVAHAKIGAPYTGEDVNYIESPHAYNSIQDFYDNTLSCVHALYGGLSQEKAYTTNSIMAYAYANYPEEAEDVTDAINTALAKVSAMKKPFVLYYQDASAGEAIDALEDFNDALSDLLEVME